MLRAFWYKGGSMTRNQFIMSPAKRSHSHNHARRQSEALRLIESPVLLAEIKDEHARAHAVIRM